jgi:type II secretory ATPase GspE/PulE/Tfp pilus assembly ATPase PilB-like protein
MNHSLQQHFQQLAPTIPAHEGEYVPKLVEAILDGARTVGISDVHLRPTKRSMEMNWRQDGVLHAVSEFPKELAPKIVARLKVLAELLTYKTDVPQEGRLRGEMVDCETRISTFPTLYGEKVVVRLFAKAGRYRHLDDLGLPGSELATIHRLLGKTGGVFLATGPAGSGKTTTIYACLREILDKSGGGRSLVSMEDPIEVSVEGVDQSQVNQTSGFDMQVGLRSLLRQDPEVIMVGEIRDPFTAQTVYQASLTGHLVLTTYHAGSATRAISRLSDMGIEPYLLRSGTLAILCQRLLRKLCSCAERTDDTDARLGLQVDTVYLPRGCEACRGTGYNGRFILAEMIEPGQDELGRAILSRSDAARLEQIAVEAGMIPQSMRGEEAVNEGLTSPHEILRVLGIPQSREQI